jgi:hypothetical protein
MLSSKLDLLAQPDALCGCFAIPAAATSRRLAAMTSQDQTSKPSFRRASRLWEGEYFAATDIGTPLLRTGLCCRRSHGFHR